MFLKDDSVTRHIDNDKSEPILLNYYKILSKEEKIQIL